jgi:hypothetical protein
VDHELLVDPNRRLVVRQTVGVQKAPRSDTTRDKGLASDIPHARGKRTAKQSVVSLRRICLEKLHPPVAGLGVVCLTLTPRGRADTSRGSGVLVFVSAGVESGALQHEMGRLSAAVVVA